MNIKKQENLLAANKLASMKFPQIRASQLAFLQVIGLKPGMTQTELCQELGVTMSAISRNVDVFGSGRAKSQRHKSYGLIEVKRDIDDERLALLYPTDKGRIFLELIEDATYGNLAD